LIALPTSFFAAGPYFAMSVPFLIGRYHSDPQSSLACGQRDVVSAVTSLVHAVHRLECNRRSDF
jgi:hypothetical protein